MPNSYDEVAMFLLKISIKSANFEAYACSKATYIIFGARSTGLTLLHKETKIPI